MKWNKITTIRAKTEAFISADKTPCPCMNLGHLPWQILSIRGACGCSNRGQSIKSWSLGAGAAGTPVPNSPGPGLCLVGGEHVHWEADTCLWPTSSSQLSKGITVLLWLLAKAGSALFLFYSFCLVLFMSYLQGFLDLRHLSMLWDLKFSQWFSVF